mmetsp:Transcript_9887/g.21488  ORF Transcript_9887/g.21488 Transcript_9887/m.21488 type:complete len:209 (-) Transcript_9887:255-881(-)
MSPRCFWLFLLLRLFRGIAAFFLLLSSGPLLLLFQGLLNLALGLAVSLSCRRLVPRQSLLFLLLLIFLLLFVRRTIVSRNFAQDSQLILRVGMLLLGRLGVPLDRLVHVLADAVALPMAVRQRALSGRVTLLGGLGPVVHGLVPILGRRTETVPVPDAHLTLRFGVSIVRSLGHVSQLDLGVLSGAHCTLHGGFKLGGCCCGRGWFVG